MSAPENPRQEVSLNAAELGMLAHLYRGEMYRSKIWRTRLDATTNWAVATTGIALSFSFSTRATPPLLVVLGALFFLVFLSMEARRSLYFDIGRKGRIGWTAKGN